MSSGSDESFESVRNKIKHLFNKNGNIPIQSISSHLIQYPFSPKFSELEGLEDKIKNRDEIIKELQYLYIKLENVIDLEIYVLEKLKYFQVFISYRNLIQMKKYDEAEELLKKIPKDHILPHDPFQEMGFTENYISNNSEAFLNYFIVLSHMYLQTNKIIQGNSMENYKVIEDLNMITCVKLTNFIVSNIEAFCKFIPKSPFIYSDNLTVLMKIFEVDHFNAGFLNLFNQQEIDLKGIFKSISEYEISSKVRDSFISALNTFYQNETDKLKCDQLKVEFLYTNNNTVLKEFDKFVF